MEEKKFIDEEKSCKEMAEVESLTEVLTKVALDLAYSSEKLVNLNGLLMQLSAEENEEEAEKGRNLDETSLESVEKALVFNLLSGVLDSEVRELDSFVVSLQAGIVDAHRNISSCRRLAEPYAMLEEKLREAEQSSKQAQYQISELKMQSAELQRAALAFVHGKSEFGEVSDGGPLSNLNGQSKLQVAGQRHILHMLEESLARELDLEKKLEELRKIEEIKIKLHYTEQVAFHMEETAQLVWGRFLEAENSTVVLQGISNDLLSRFQQFQFNFNSMVQCESELKSKYDYCLEELKLKDIALETLTCGGLGNGSNDAERSALKVKVKFLEEKLKESELQHRNENAINKASQTRLTELKILVDSLRESIDIADTTAESAELKVVELTSTNIELTDELNFHKGSVDNMEKKVGVLEKQLREAEFQLQHAKASSEASQEQQNMLYSAIWDMETLIEDLNSKVAKFENKNESTVEKIMLSETNAEMMKEISLLRRRIEDLEGSLDQAKRAKIESANEVSVRTRLIMNMVVQLAAERERIQNQLNTLTKENEELGEKLGSTAKDSAVGHENKEEDNADKELPCSFKSDLSNSCCAKSSMESVEDYVGKSFQFDELSEEPPLNNGTQNPTFVNTITNNGVVSKLEDAMVALANWLSLKYVRLAIFVSLVSVSVMYFVNHKQYMFY